MILTYLPVVFVVVAVAQGTTTMDISTVKVTAGGDTSNSPTTLHMTTSSNLNSKPTASSVGSPSTPASGGTASSASPETSYTSARLTPTRGDISPSARLTPTRGDISTSVRITPTNNDTTSNEPIKTTKSTSDANESRATSIGATRSTTIMETSDNASQITTTNVDLTSARITPTSNSTTAVSPSNTINKTTITNTFNGTTLIADTTQPVITTNPVKDTTQPVNTTNPSQTDTTQPAITTSPVIDTAQPGNTTSPVTNTTQPAITTGPVIDTTQPGNTTSPVTDSTHPASSTADLTTNSLTNPINTTPGTATNFSTTNIISTTVTEGPPASPSTSASTAVSILPSTTPAGNTTTLGPQTATSGVTEHTAETTETHSPTAATSPTSDDTDRTTINVTTHQPTPPATSSSSITAAPPTLSPVIVCPAIPCPRESVCLNGTCQCLTGRYLLNGRCESGQVFPGRLHVTSLNFTNEMSDRSSRAFQETAAIISEPLREALKNLPGYLQTDVVQLQPGSVVATVNNIFQNTNQTEQSVDEIIKKAISNSTGVLSDATFTSMSLCEQTPKPCQVSTTLCTNIKGQAVCSCKEGYVSDVYSNTSCRACPSGQRKVGEECQPCSFGYAGFNCNDSSLLALVIVSCVLGGILLILILALLIYWCWRKCSESKSGDNTSPYSSEDSSKPWPTAITPIPRASSNWDAAPSIEMAEGGSTHTLVDKKRYSNGLSASYDLNPEDMKTFKGKNTSRYSYLVQGHENPYFLPGDEKRN